MKSNKAIRAFLTPIAIFFLLSIFHGPEIHAQDNKLRLHAISGSVGIAGSSSDTAGSGFGFDIDLSTILKENLFSFYFNSGWNLNSGGPDEEFYSLNLTYGRKWTISERWSLETHAGIGWFGYHIETGSLFFGDLPDNTVGFPLRLKLLHHLSDRFGIGLNPNINFNSVETAYSGHLVIQYHFNK